MIILRLVLFTAAWGVVSVTIGPRTQRRLDWLRERPSCDRAVAARRSRFADA